jgi:hypothetical protein
MRADSTSSRLAGSAVDASELEAEGDEDAALDVWREVLGSDDFQPGTRSPEEVLSAWRPRASWQLRIAGIDRDECDVRGDRAGRS